MVFEFKLPDIGEGVHEGEIVKWLVKEGDAVGEDQPIVEVMTDKATVELTAPRAGKIAQIKAQEGQVIPVGTVFVTIEESGGGGQAPAAPKEDARGSEQPGAKEKEEKTLFEGQPSVELVKRRRRGRGDGTTTNGGTAPAVTHPAGRPIAAPAVRRRAREMGLDLAAVQGSGPAGRITHADLESSSVPEPSAPSREGTPVEPAATAAAARPAPPASSRFKAGTTIPFRGLRRKIADGMRKSKDTAAHFTYVEEVDASELVALVDSSKPLADRRGIKMTLLPFVVKAAVAALKSHPIVNSRQAEAGGDVELLDHYHIGIAVATEQGLIVPVVRDADKKSVFQIAKEIAELSDKTRRGKATVQELTGSTFTITSLGRIGGVLATPIINIPEVAIMGIHAIKDRPVIKDGKIVPGKVMNLSFSFDHRIVDGYEGAEFAQTIVRFLADPKLLLLEAA